MSVSNVGTGYVFVIDTNQYAGNFEREMCAYMTGMVGDCGVGQNSANQFAEDMGVTTDDDGFEENNPFDGFVNYILCDDGCHRPTSIWLGPKERKCQHNSVAIFLDGKPSVEEFNLLKERAYKFAMSNDLQIEGFRFLKVIPERYEEVKSFH